MKKSRVFYFSRPCLNELLLTHLHNEFFSSAPKNHRESHLCAWLHTHCTSREFTIHHTEIDMDYWRWMSWKCWLFSHCVWIAHLFLVFSLITFAQFDSKLFFRFFIFSWNIFFHAEFSQFFNSSWNFTALASSSLDWIEAETVFWPHSRRLEK